MQYDLKCNKCNKLFWIKCSLKDKPRTHSELYNGIQDGTIQQQVSSKKLNVSNDCDGVLETDFSTQKPIRHNINWIATDLL